MNIYLRIGAAMLAASSLAACATVTRGTKQSYKIMSEPSGANVALTTGETCVTPCKLKLKRKHDFTATFTMDGYEPAEANVESKFSGGGGAALAGNVLVGGIIGGAVDGANGSLNSLFPGELNVTLVPLSQASTLAAGTASASASAASPE